MPKRVAILQSSYSPWKGYFDIIHDVDELTFYDDVQHTKHDWRNHNRAKTPAGPAWLTIPEATILDLIFHTGPEAPRYIRGWRTHTS